MKQRPYFPYLRSGKVRAGDLIGMGQHLGSQLQLVLHIPGETAEPVVLPDSVGSPSSASLKSQPDACRAGEFTSSLTCFLHHPNQKISGNERLTQILVKKRSSSSYVAVCFCIPHHIFFSRLLVLPTSGPVPDTQETHKKRALPLPLITLRFNPYSKSLISLTVPLLP